MTLDSLRRVYAQGFPMTYFTALVDRQREVFPDLGLNLPFIDNHDQPRFLALNSNPNDLKNALAVNFFFEV